MIGARQHHVSEFRFTLASEHMRSRIRQNSDAFRNSPETTSGFD